MQLPDDCFAGVRETEISVNFDYPRPGQQMLDLPLAGPFGQHSNQYLDMVIRRILIPPHPSLPSSLEASYEIRPTV